MTTNGNSGGRLGHGFYFEDLSVGMEASYAKKISDKDVLAFADLSGDVNPLHLSDDFAAGTLFKARATLACACAVDGKTVLDGEAVMMVDRRTPRQ